MVSRSSYALARVSSRASRLVGRPRVRVLDAFVRSRSRGTRARRCDGACSIWIVAILSTLTRRCATVRVPFGSMDGSVTIVARRRRRGGARGIYIYAWRARACVSIHMRDARATPRAPLNRSIDRSHQSISQSVTQKLYFSPRDRRRRPLAAAAADDDRAVIHARTAPRTRRRTAPCFHAKIRPRPPVNTKLYFSPRDRRRRRRRRRVSRDGSTPTNALVVALHSVHASRARVSRRRHHPSRASNAFAATTDRDFAGQRRACVGACVRGVGA